MSGGCSSSTTMWLRDTEKREGGRRGGGPGPPISSTAIVFDADVNHRETEKLRDALLHTHRSRGRASGVAIVVSMLEDGNGGGEEPLSNVLHR